MLRSYKRLRIIRGIEHSTDRRGKAWELRRAMCFTASLPIRTAPSPRSTLLPNVPWPADVPAPGASNMVKAPLAVRTKP